eukprot:gene5565-7687_t
MLFRTILFSTYFLSISSFRATIFPKNGFQLFMSDSVETRTPNSFPQVFIGNLPFDVDEATLSAAVSQRVSNFVGFRLAMDKKTGRSRGFGYLDFNDKTEAEAAVSALSGLQFDGRSIKVDVSEPRERRPSTGNNNFRAPSENSVYIGNLEFSVSEQQIMEMCNDLVGAGIAQKVRIITDKETGRPRGFGYIDFSNPEDAAKAVGELNGVSLLGRDLRVNVAQKKEDLVNNFGGEKPFTPREPRAPRTFNREQQQHSIFLGNLAWDASQEIIEDMINDVLGPGLFSRVRLAMDRETGRPKGFGHIDFKDAESAERAIVELNGLELLGRQLRADHAARKDPSAGPRF